MTAYDDWKLSGPPEAEEEQMLAQCVAQRYETTPCDFDGYVTCQIAGDKLTWTCLKCDTEYEESTRDRFDDN